VLFGLVPKTLWEQGTRPDDRNRLRLELRCLLIQTGQACILVGTGFGDKLSEEQRDAAGLDGKNRLLESLEGLGIGPQDVDLVVNTHLHTHHCGGNTTVGSDGALAPTFPRATYCVQRLELADARFPNERTRAWYHSENVARLERDGRLRILSGDTRLTDHVRVIVAPGHTRAHQCVVIGSAGRTALFVGSAAYWPIHQERLSWVPAYDVEPLVSIETKRNLARWAVDNRALLIFEHHPEIEAGYLQATGRPDRFRLDPVPIGG
jgi:glyoxylase-like metal-dependent hydrolase (beta-lactamase superfamily II)